MKINPVAVQAFLSQASNAEKTENRTWYDFEAKSNDETIKLWGKRITQFETNHLHKLEACIDHQESKLKNILENLRKPNREVSVLAKLDTQVRYHFSTHRINLLRAYKDLSSIFTASDLQKFMLKNNHLTELRLEYREGVTNKRYCEIVQERAHIFLTTSDKAREKADELVKRSTQQFHALARCNANLSNLRGNLADIAILLCKRCKEMDEKQLKDPENTQLARTQQHLYNSTGRALATLNSTKMNTRVIDIKFSRIRQAHRILLGIKDKDIINANASTSLISQSQQPSPT